MSSLPILVIQMQRMGDLVLSFPLFAWLGKIYPDTPLWVVGEPDFYNPLMALSPKATYFSYDSAKRFVSEKFSMVINLSHRPEASAIASSVKSNEIFGCYQNSHGDLKINGDWFLYKASLTQNNYFNLFHWSDLHGLDLIPESLRRETLWPEARSLSGAAPNARIGLFLGASEKEKRPDVEFWIALTRRLYALGFKPVFLGGKAEAELGTAVAKALNAHSSNFCGRFSVEELTHFIQKLDLLVTPDTGPMHIAAWTSTPVLNLSFGPVNPWETGPFSRGNYIYRPIIECSGCWECTQPNVLCKEMVKANDVASLIQSLLQGKEYYSKEKENLLLLQTKRDSLGLFSTNVITRPKDISTEYKNIIETLSPLQKEIYLSSCDKTPFSFQYIISNFWKSWFLSTVGHCEDSSPEEIWKIMQILYPEIVLPFQKAIVKFSIELSAIIRGKKSIESFELWENAPSFLRPFTGYAHMYLQNEGNNRKALAKVLRMLEKLLAQIS